MAGWASENRSSYMDGDRRIGITIFVWQVAESYHSLLFYLLWQKKNDTSRPSAGHANFRKQNTFNCVVFVINIDVDLIDLIGVSGFSGYFIFFCKRKCVFITTEGLVFLSDEPRLSTNPMRRLAEPINKCVEMLLCVNRKTNRNKILYTYSHTSV